MSERTNESPLPCPFCGSRALADIFHTAATVSCSSDGCGIYMIDLDNPFCDEVVAKWNKRARTEEQMSWNEERQENAYYLKGRKAYSTVYDGDIRKLFEERMRRIGWQPDHLQWGYRGYHNEEVSRRYSDFYNGFRMGEDAI